MSSSTAKGVVTDTGRWAAVTEWLLDSGVSDKAIRLFAVLHCKYADKEVLTAHPSRRTLAADAHCSLDSVDRAIRELVEVGALAVERRKGPDGDWTSSIYSLRLSRPPSRTDAATGSREDAATGSRTDAAQIQNQLDPESTDPESSSSGGGGSRASAVDPPFATAIRAIENLVGSLNPTIAERIDEYLGSASARGPTTRESRAEWIEAACEEAALSNGRSWKYVAAVLERWEREGFRSERQTNGRSQEGRNQGGGRSTDRRREEAARRRGGEW